MAFSRGPSIVTDGLVLALDAANHKSYPGSGTSWYDLSSNKNTYTLNNGPTFNSDNGGSIVFDGADDYATSSAPLSAGASTYSIEAYWKAHSLKTQVIWEQNSSTLITGKRVCMILLSNGNGGFNGQSADFHSSVPYSINTWYHWIITVDTNLGSNQIKIYVDGNFYVQGNPSSTLNAGADEATVGHKVPTDSEEFDGNIALVRVYNKVLSASEVQQNYNATKSRFGL